MFAFATASIALVLPTPPPVQLEQRIVQNYVTAYRIDSESVNPDVFPTVIAA